MVWFWVRVQDLTGLDHESTPFGGVQSFRERPQFGFDHHVYRSRFGRACEQVVLAQNILVQVPRDYGVELLTEGA